MTLFTGLTLCGSVVSRAPRVVLPSGAGSTGGTPQHTSIALPPGIRPLQAPAELSPWSGGCAADARAALARSRAPCLASTRLPACTSSCESRRQHCQPWPSTAWHAGRAANSSSNSAVARRTSLAMQRARCSAVLLLLTLSCLTTVLPAAGQDNLIRYDQLTPFANVVDIKRIWRVLKLPELPPTFCHVGLLGWHCHNTTMQPWDPRSLIPKDQIPPMPANASCVICPNGWHGTRRNLVDVLIDLPFVQAASGGQQHKLPTGFYDMHVLQQDAQAAQQQQQQQQQQQPVAASARP